MAYTLQADLGRRRATVDFPFRTGIFLPWLGDEQQIHSALDREEVDLGAEKRAAKLQRLLLWVASISERTDPRVKVVVNSVVISSEPGYLEVVFNGTYRMNPFVCALRTWTEEDEISREVFLAANTDGNRSINRTLPVESRDTFARFLFACGWGVFAPILDGLSSHQSILRELNEARSASAS